MMQKIYSTGWSLLAAPGSQNNVTWWKRREGKSARSNFLRWIVPFDLECCERRALCNIFSTHMADCVTAKHTHGGREREREREMDVSGETLLLVLGHFPY